MYMSPALAALVFCISQMLYPAIVWQMDGAGLGGHLIYMSHKTVPPVPPGKGSPTRFGAGMCLHMAIQCIKVFIFFYCIMNRCIGCHYLSGQTV